MYTQPRHKAKPMEDVAQIPEDYRQSEYAGTESMECIRYKLHK